MCAKCEEAPWCYWCGERTARRLAGMSEGLQSRVYCSYFCAAQSALLSDQQRGLFWCQNCQNWHNDHHPCGSVDVIGFTLGKEVDCES